MTEQREEKTIICINCRIRLVATEQQSVAHVKWNNNPRVTQTYTNETTDEDNMFIIPHPTQGFYYLHGNQILHVINEHTRKIVVSDPKIEPDNNWFGNSSKDELFYFPKYNVLFVTFFGGDHDYIWWWNLSIYNQDTKISDPCYYNGVFNATLYLEKGNERYAIGTYYGYSDDDGNGEEDKDEDEDEDEDESDDEDKHTDAMIIIFDTKKMKYHEYSREDLETKTHTSSNTNTSKRTLKELTQTLLASLPL